ncbi:L-arabinonate dehydratase [Lentzea sp. BCCO 10_0798]|uniref:L-arabinonate dehydratase n=1 Tax=Lentzea kristufekii TaxID=3095430 RepID=A0ABU4U4R8_9PSEU|nr:L-arabinonate dehydratase [Lentzea sp. BCCO 10_0798]MDX8055566.1 L-arabinonate dehydratase [Lentzea sp. BCCO 10_0798]
MTSARKKLRSAEWFEGEGLRAFSHNARMRQLGMNPSEHLGKPVIAILNTWSGINPCHMHLRERAQQVERGVWEAGGYPVEFPVSTLSETYQKPTPMMYRNMLSMETEEILRSYPVDGCVLMGGCDKTTPALLMGAASAGLPAVFVPAGPMLRGHWRGEKLASGTDMWRFWDEKRAGTISSSDWSEIQSGLARSPGTCMTMGTASTMTAAAEALGLTLPGASSIPAVDSAHHRMAAASGMRVVEMVREGLTIGDVLSAEAYEDAIRTVLALGGSTNSYIHLIAMAGRSQIPLSLDDFDRLSREVPVLASVQPAGSHLMEDFYYAGGLRGLLSRLRESLHLERITVTGRTFGEDLEGAEVYDSSVIRPVDDPISAEGGLAVLRGNLAPDGAVIKYVAADPALWRHTGPAVVFHGYKDLQARINDPSLDVTKDSVIVLAGGGPKGGPGMPEYGMLPIPDKLLHEGVRDMVRVSDARMSGTSYGACVLHVAPEAHVGGPLALVRDGDLVTLDVEARVLRVEISDEEMTRRRDAWTPPPAKFERGYGALYYEHITQADEGCDFEFLSRPGTNPEPNAR